MASISTWFGTNAKSGTYSELSTYLGTLTGTSDQFLLVKWGDVAPALTGAISSTPSSGEDWLAASSFNAVTVTVNSLNASRKAAATMGALSIDQGFYLAGNVFEVYSVTVNFYLPSTLPPRPGLVGN